MPETMVNYIRRYTSIAAVFDILTRRELPLLDPQTWDDRNDRHFMALYKQYRRLGALYGLCATQAPETYHHWRVFTNGADGACLEIDRHALTKAMTMMPELSFKSVRYLKLEAVKKLGLRSRSSLPFIKRWGFRHEREFRIVAESSGSQQPIYPISLDLNWIKAIHLNPWLPPALSDTLVQRLRSIPGCAALAIQRSGLIDNYTWKAEGNRIAGTGHLIRPRPRKKVN